MGNLFCQSKAVRHNGLEWSLIIGKVILIQFKTLGVIILWPKRLDHIIRIRTITDDKPADHIIFHIPISPQSNEGLEEVRLCLQRRLRLWVCVTCIVKMKFLKSVRIQSGLWTSQEVFRESDSNVNSAKVVPRASRVYSVCSINTEKCAGMLLLF